MNRSRPSLREVWLSICHVALALQVIPSVAALLVAGGVWLATEDREGALHLATYGLVITLLALAVWKWVPRPCRSALAVNSAAVTVAWLLASLLISIPILTICQSSPSTNETVRALATPLNAWYEGTSSISSSGLTTAAKSTDIPPSIQLWRSVCQWIGGVGLAVFALLILKPAEFGSSLYTAETRSWQATDSVRATVLRVLAVYVGLTISCGILFALAGMPAWETLNHCLVIVSTGGLTVTNDSFTSYSLFIQFTAAMFMIAAAVSFGTIYLIGARRFKQLFTKTDLHILLLWLITMILIFHVSSYLGGDDLNTGSMFNLISAITTCGVSSGELLNLKVTSVWLIIIAMLVGGCEDSTSGGIKLNRVVWMLKVTLAQIKENLSSEGGRVQIQWNHEEVDNDEALQRTSRTLVMTFLFLTSISIGYLLLRLSYSNEISSDRVFFQAASALGAVGLSMDLTGPDRPEMAKAVEIFLMLAGRLEIMAVLLFIPVAIGRVSHGGGSGEPKEPESAE